MVRPMSKPGLENLWIVLALLSGLQFAVWVGFLLGADWPFGTLLTVAPIIIANTVSRVIRNTPGVGDFQSVVSFLVIAAAFGILVWTLLSRKPKSQTQELLLDRLEDGDQTGVIEEGKSLGSFLKTISAAVVLLWLRFKREPRRRAQILLGLGGGALLYLLFLILTVLLIGTEASRARMSESALRTPNSLVSDGTTTVNRSFLVKVG